MELVSGKLTVKEQAQKEVFDELNKESVKAYKKKLKELHAAKEIVKNISREIEDMEEVLEQKMKDLDE